MNTVLTSKEILNQVGARRVLVIGSQCDALPPLSFLPNVAEELYEAMTDPKIGCCLPSLPEGQSKLIDPTVHILEAAIISAFRSASEEQAMLFLAYIGHGIVVGDDFYLLPKNGNPEEAAVRGKSVDIVQVIKGLYAHHSNITGMVMLLDACHSGFGAVGFSKWQDAKFPFRYEVLTATSHLKAYDGCFTKTIVNRIKGGINHDILDHLRCERLRTELKEACPNQNPRHVFSDAESDMFVARNLARLEEATAFTPHRTLLENLTRSYAPIPQLKNILGECHRNRCIAIIGSPGTGKSALIAALSEIGTTSGFAHGVAFTSLTETMEGLAETLANQLNEKVPGYKEAVKNFRSNHQLEWSQLNAFTKFIVGPITSFDTPPQVRLAIDGLDQLNQETLGLFLTQLNRLTTAEDTAHVSVIVTSRFTTILPEGALQIILEPVSQQTFESYLAIRNVPQNVWPQIILEGEGNWLFIKLYADLVLKAGQDEKVLPDKDSIYDRLLLAASKDMPWGTHLRPILTVLAVAGVGPVLPLALLYSASRTLGGPEDLSQVIRVLASIRELVVRGQAGTHDEQVGLFHLAFADFLLQTTGHWRVDSEAGHRAVLTALENLAPVGEYDPTNSLHRYAAIAEAEHFLELGEYTRTVQSLSKRQSLIPPKKLLDIWQRTKFRIEATLGPDHPDTLETRSNVASWTGQTGHPTEALRLFTELLPDLQRVLGPDHPETLITRGNIAAWIGQTGHPTEALRLFTELLPDLQRVLGPDHPGTLTTQNNIASFTGEAGNSTEALGILTGLLADRQRVLGPDHPDTLQTHGNLAGWTGMAGNPREALRLFKDLLPTMERVLGQIHPQTLNIRNNIAAWTNNSGNPREAIRLFLELLPDLEREQGSDHPDTLRVRNNIAFLMGKIGKYSEALRLSTRLMHDRERVLGPHHPETLNASNNLATWTGKAGTPAKALHLFSELLPKVKRVLGPDHPDTLKVRNNHALWKGEAGDPFEAIHLFSELLPDVERVLGRNHPGTLATRNNLAAWTGSVGHFSEALRLFSELLPDRMCLLGSNHPDTLETKINLAFYTGKAGNPRKARRLLAELLPDVQRILGTDHPNTFHTRINLATWTGESGQPSKALNLFNELLPDMVRVLGPNHPNILKTRGKIAFWIAQNGNPSQALGLSISLLSEIQRILGPDHIETLITRGNIAAWTGESGHPREALRLFKELLPKIQSLYGPHNPYTLVIRNNIASWTGKAGNPRKALGLFIKLLPDIQRVLGSDHPNALKTNNALIILMARMGDTFAALQLFNELFPKLVRVLGVDHPETVLARNWITFLN